MSNSRITELTLLSWLVNTFPINIEVESIADLSDGIIFSKMIEHISPEYAIHDLEQNTGPSKWLSNKKSLEAVYKSLLRYIGEKCPNLDSVAFESKVDLNAIAEQKNPQETIKLLTIFLMAAVEGPNNRDYISLITTKLDTPAQEEIKKIIMQANTLSRQTVRSTTRSAATPTIPNKDYDLDLEEKHAVLRVEYENLKKKHADFMTRFERLTISHDELIQHSNDVDSRLRSLQDSKDDDQTTYIKKQTERIRELEDIIASQEQQLEADRALQEKQSRELHSLRPIANTVTECQDQLKEIKVENLNLVKKANKVDHYLKKLENHAALQKENVDLRERIDLLEENQKDYDRVHEENARYKKTATEYSSRFQEQELHIVELSSQKNALKQELQILNDRIAELNERQQHDEKFINELQEQLRTSSGPLSSDPNALGNRGLSLEEELEQVEDSPNLALEDLRLKSEAKFLQGNSVNSKITQLNIDLAESERAKKQLEERYQELFEKLMIEQQQSNAVTSNVTSEINESLANSRKMYLEISQELITSKSRLAQLQSESKSRDRELLEKNQLIATLLSNGTPSIGEDDAKILAEQKLQNQTNEVAALESLVRNLTRENALIASAWYELTNRIQSNHVVLQRRQDAPKSWINKQRQTVNSSKR